MQELGVITIIIKPTGQQLNLELDPSTSIQELYDFVKNEFNLQDDYEKWTCNTLDNVQLKLEDVVGNQKNGTLIIQTEAKLNLLFTLRNGSEIKAFQYTYNPQTTMEELANSNLKYFQNWCQFGDSSNIDITISQIPYNDSCTRKMSLKDLNIDQFSLVQLRWINSDLMSLQNQISNSFHQKYNDQYNNSMQKQNIQDNEEGAKDNIWSEIFIDSQKSTQQNTEKLYQLFPFSNLCFLKDGINNIFKKMQQSIIQQLQELQQKLIQQIENINQIKNLEFSFQFSPSILNQDEQSQKDVETLHILKKHYQKYNEIKDALSIIDYDYNKYIKSLSEINFCEDEITKFVYLFPTNEALILKMGSEVLLSELFQTVQQKFRIKVPFENWKCRQQMYLKENLLMNDPVKSVESEILIIDYDDLVKGSS